MPLRLSLKPQERVIIGGAVVRNGDSRTEIFVENQIPILREADILSPSAVKTPCERVYLAVQLMYVDQEHETPHRRFYEELVSDPEGAEEALRRVIEMGDAVPQPWGNLAGCLIMQERYDEAEEALHRALEIEPDYDLAQRNLALLPIIRQTGVPDFEVRQPFKGRKLKQSITFVRE